MITKQVAQEFFKQWRQFSVEALKILAPTCPSSPPKSKTRPWHPDGKGFAVGLLCHYTGGLDGVASIRWFNENKENKGSSCSSVVFDTCYKQLEELCIKYPLVNIYLPVTALLIADISYATWHGNWVNSRCFGIENRNLGLLEKRGTKFYRSGKLYTKAKTPIVIRNQWWEPYTKEQIIANINIGRMIRAIQEGLFDPSWVIPHSAIWATKSDTGSAFPMYNIRAAIFSDTELKDLQWLNKYHSAETCTHVPEEININELDSNRDCAPPTKLTNEPTKVDNGNWKDYLPVIRKQLDSLWYHVVQSNSKEFDNTLKLAVYQLQRSSHALQNGRHLAIDGIPGAKTRAFIEERFKAFHLSYAKS